jgi:UDP-glucose 4-epimerase
MAAVHFVMTKFVLLSGGAGYVGSHTLIELLSTLNYSPIVVDNLNNSSSECLKRIEMLTQKAIPFYNIDLASDPETSGLKDLFKKYNFYAVINFAGLKAVGESMRIPLDYYQVNLNITFNLLSMMKEFGVTNFVFSSSACVYGEPRYLPIDEKHPAGSCTNPYGKTKYFIEEVLRDVAHSDSRWNVVVLRYFNPVGAHESGEIGEDPNGIPNNLMPFVSKVAIGELPMLSVFGDDFDTPDGTGVRDYIHVVDLAIGHVSSLKLFERNCGFKIYNLGKGRGYSVLEVIEGMRKASGREIPYKIVGRRDGDVATSYSDASLARDELGWEAVRDLDQMCADTWRWQEKNPKGFK